MNKNKFTLLINSFWAIPLVFLLRLLNQFIKVQIIKIRSDRFGHFAPDGAEQVARFQMKNNGIKFYIFDWYICNKQWEKMLRKKLPIYDLLKFVYFWNEYIMGGNEINRTGTKTKSRDTELLFTKYDVRLPFEQQEENDSLSWLKEKGWTEGEQFYCLIIRDNAYLNETSNFKEDKWEYHDYRNSNINNFHKTIEWLTKQGIWGIMMGKAMKSPLNSNNQKVIDFPFEKTKFNLLDIWLFANCNGCISTGTGPDLLTGIYGKKILFLNFLPLFALRSDLNSLTCPKKLTWKEGNKAFTMDDYISDRRMRSDQYKADGIEITEMTENEILNVTKEFYIQNTQKSSNKIKPNQAEKLFWKKLVMANKNLKSLTHNKIHPKSNISKTWLKSLNKL